MTVNMPDTITVEIIRAALNAAAQRMRITLIKTAYNHIISESLDFGCAIICTSGSKIAQPKSRLSLMLGV